MSGFDIASFRDRLPRSRKANKAFNLQDDGSSGSDSSDSEDYDRRRKRSRRVVDFTQSKWSDESDDEKDALKDSIATESSATATPAASSAAPESSSSSMATEHLSQQHVDLLDDLDDKKPVDTFIILTDEEEEQDIKELHNINGRTSPKRPHPSTPEQQQPMLPKKPRISVPSFNQIEDLDPDLASISAPSPSSGTQNPSRATSDSPAPAQKVLIKVCYTTARITNDEKVKVLIDKLKKPLSVYVMENDPFDKLLTRYAQHKALRKGDLQLVYKDVPVVLRATPASLGMITGGQVKNLMQVYVKEDYERFIQEELQKKEEMEKMFDKPITDDELFASNNTTTAEENTPSTQSTDTEERLFLKLRGKDGDDVVCRVKKTTTLANLVKNYCSIKRLGDSVAGKIELSFEGETLSPKDRVEDTELENEDIVTVTIIKK